MRREKKERWMAQNVQSKTTDLMFPYPQWREFKKKRIRTRRSWNKFLISRRSTVDCARYARYEAVLPLTYNAIASAKPEIRNVPVTAKSSQSSRLFLGRKFLGSARNERENGDAAARRGREERRERGEATWSGRSFVERKSSPGSTRRAPFVPRDPATLISEKPRMRHTSRDVTRWGGKTLGNITRAIEIEEVEIVDATDRWEASKSPDSDDPRKIDGSSVNWSFISFVPRNYVKNENKHRNRNTSNKYQMIFKKI